MIQANNLDKVERALREHAKKKHRRFGSDDNVPVKLLGLTYGDLVKTVEFGIANGMGPYLHAVANRQRETGRAALDCLVVNRRSGLPGAGWRGDGKFPRADWEDEVRRCIAEAGE